jgi:polyisoprenoid-binding protein YceI
MRKEIPLMLLSALLATGAWAAVPQPLTEQASAPQVTAPAEPAAAPEPRVYVVDAQGSEVLIYVRSKGRAAKLGTNHVVQVNGLEGEVWLRHPIQDSSLRLWFPVQALQVDDPELRARAPAEFQGEVPQDQAEEVRITMLNERVLNAQGYPVVTLAAKVSGGALPGLELDLEVALHGVKRRIEKVPVEIETGERSVTARGRFTIRQSDFGITPLTLLLGSLKVDDELTIAFRIEARQR